MLCAGSVRKKNLQNTMLKNILDACGAAVGFYTIGYALAFGDQEGHTDFTFVGTTDFFATKNDIDPAFWFFEFCFAASAATSELLFTSLSHQRFDLMMSSRLVSSLQSWLGP
jgi:ammonium transporter, Amt family